VKIVRMIYAKKFLKPAEDVGKLSWLLFVQRRSKGTRTADLLANAGVHAMVYPLLSWRVGAFPRIARSLANRAWAWLPLGPGSHPRRMARRWSVVGARYFIARPLLVRPARQLLRRFPAIAARLRMMLLSPEGTRRASIPSSLSDLSSHARGVYTELKAAFAKIEASR
jgi:hypothetical protein